MAKPITDERLYFNGINGATGDYSLPVTTVENLYKTIVGQTLNLENLKELKYKSQLRVNATYGVQQGIDYKDLAEAGWGVIFPASSDPKWTVIREALSPLLQLRQNQAGPLYKEYFGMQSGYRTNENKTSFLKRFGKGLGPADPQIVPYYLLIVGNPEDIPFEFQNQLSVQYAVGRVDFDTPENYAAYANSVIAVETGQIALPRQLTFFGTAHPNDPATQASSELLVKPLSEALRSEKPDWQVSDFLGLQASKAQLARLLGGDQTPALLVTANHGLSFPVDDPGQVQLQGALLCQDWPGPQAGLGGPIPADYYFASQDVPDGANLLGLISLHFASYGAGSSNSEIFTQMMKGQHNTPRNFTSQLPMRLLSRGALAVIGQIDFAWGYFGGIGRSLGNSEGAIYESILRRLLDGFPVGEAFGSMKERYAELSTELTSQLEDASFGTEIDPLKLIAQWTANNDARSYIILGDPAVRMVVNTVSLTGKITRSILDLKSTPRPVPTFITLLQSRKEEDILLGAKEAVLLVQRSNEILERDFALMKDGEDNIQLDPDEQKVAEDVKSLRAEISRLATIVREGIKKDREEALFVLEKLGPTTRTETLPLLKERVLNDQDFDLRPKMVRAIVSIENNRTDLAAELRVLLREGTLEVRAEVLEALKNLKPAYKEIIPDLWPLTTDDSLSSKALEAIFAVQDDKAQLLTQVIEHLDQAALPNPQARQTVGSLFLQEKTALEATWGESRENKSRILDLILDTLALGTPSARQDATTWLLQHDEDIPGEALDRMVKTVKKLFRLDDDANLQESLTRLTEKLVARKRAERNILLNDLRDKDSTIQIEAIKRAAESEDEWALRILVQEWVQWVALGQSEKTQLVEEAAEKMRGNALSVLPLVNQLTQDFQPGEDLLKTVSAVSQTLNQTTNSNSGADGDLTNAEALKTRIDALLKEELNSREWNVHQRILKQLVYRKDLKFDEETIRKEIISQIKLEFKERELNVKSRIARQLADMSNPFFFDKDIRNEKYQAIKGNLEKYAVPILARILPEAADDDIRKDLAYALGNVGGREAVDALARAVVGEERTRANRQKLLAEYYLDPSKRRSDEASEILKGAVDAAKNTLWLQQALNIVLFAVGLGVLVGGLIMAFTNQDSATRIAGVLAGLGGFGGVILQLIRNPLDRIQNAMANLVQLETAFTSFIWELNLNGTYIQSQYVAEGILTDDDIAQTVLRIETAMSLTLDHVAVYTGQVRQANIPHLTSLSPMVGAAGTVVAVFGQNLRRDIQQNGDKLQAITIAINHVPTVTKDLSKDATSVKFELPPNLNQTLETVWISVIVDGKETNALPFQVIVK